MKEDWPQVGNCLSLAMGTGYLLFSRLYVEVLENFYNEKRGGKKRLGLRGNNNSFVITFSVVSNWLLGLEAVGSGQSAVLSEDI